MNTLNDSVIICDTPPKSTRKKVSLNTKKIQKNAKKTFYESPLKHIQLSNKRWKQRQAKQKLMNNAKQLVNNQKNSFFPINDLSFQDSILILSDNESESNNQNDKNNCPKETKKRKNLETLVEDKQSPQRDTEIEICPKRRKINSPILSPNNSCFLISDTEDAEIISVDLVNENIAPASSSVNQTADDIVVVWSSKKASPLSTNGSEGEKTITEEEEKDKIFMIDHNPNLENLNYLQLECNKESSYNGCKKSSERSTKESTEATNEKSTEITTEKSTKENAEISDEEQDPKYLPFSKRGLKLPKAHNISKTIQIKKSKNTNTFLNYRRQVSQSSTSTIPSVSMQKALNVTRFEPTTTEASRLEAPGSALPRFEAPRFEPSRPEQPKKLREIIIDGNNVAMAHKNNTTFSEEGIVLVMDYFQRRGHTVKIFVPQYRRSSLLLEKLYREGIVIFTPSRRIGGKRITPYDDRFILEYATVSGGIVISLDQYRDLYREKPEWRDTIEKRLLAPTFVGDYVMFPEDPLGRNGPSLDEFLRY